MCIIQNAFRSAMCILAFIAMAISCNSNRTKQQALATEHNSKTGNIVHCVDSEDESKDCNCAIQFELGDSNQLIHIKDEFYKSSNGHLYEKTIGLKNVNGHLVDHEYFNGYLSQEVDPLSFEVLDGWYAKDNNHVYYYRPVSGGMQISTLDKADSKTFKLIEKQYRYGADKNYVFEETSVIDSLDPATLRLVKDSKGNITELVSGYKHYAIGQ